MKWLMSVLMILVLVGCKGSDGDDGKINVKLTGDTTFTNSAFAIGCFVIDSSTTRCLCAESGTYYTGTASGSVTCQGYASDVTMVDNNTSFTSVAAGDHTWNLTTTPGTDPSADKTGTVTLTATSGESGSSTAAVLPENGDNGADKTYTVTFTTTTATAAE